MHEDKETRPPGDDEEFDEIWPEFDEAEWEEERARNRRRIRLWISILISLALIVQLVAVWPLIYNINALKFLDRSEALMNQEEIREYARSIVTIEADGRQGTGFRVYHEAANRVYIVTNYHVIEDALDVQVGYPPNEVWLAERVAEDPDRDLAILAVDAPGDLIPALTLNEDWEAELPVTVIGNPLYFDRIASDGAVAGELTPSSWREPVLIVDAPIFSGNSGSPVIGPDGNVVGVIYATTDSQINGKQKKVGLALPASDVIELLPAEE